MQYSSRTLVHTVLAVDYLVGLARSDAESTAIVKAFASSMARPKSLVRYVQRHPPFAEQISSWADRSVTQEAIHASIRILEAAQPADVFVMKMHEWLSSDDEQHVQFAIKNFGSPTSSSIAENGEEKSQRQSLD